MQRSTLLAKLIPAILMVSQAVTGEYNEHLLRPRLLPPPPPLHRIRRVRVEQRLAVAVDAPLTIVVAPPGSGKTVALAALASHGGWPAAWCRADADDDPPRLLAHLAAALSRVTSLDPNRLPRTIDGLINALTGELDDETLLIIDDAHLIDEQPNLRTLIERFIVAQPPRLHLVLAGRREPDSPLIATARLRGEALLIEAADLLFTSDEAAQLWQQAGKTLPVDFDELMTFSAGWPLALRIALDATDWRSALGLREQKSKPVLDDYLEREVFALLPEPLQRCLQRSAGLRWITPDLCAALDPTFNASELIAELRRRRLFVEPFGEHGVRFQPLIAAWLSRRAAADPEWVHLHRRAAAYFQQHGDHESALYHQIAAGDPAAVTTFLPLARTLLAERRAEAVLDWMRRLALTGDETPELIELQAAALHQLNRLEAALATYRRAERAFAASGDRLGQSRCLRGQAAIYLDTVQPAPATDLLRRALKLLPRQCGAERIELLLMQAENWANRGRADIGLRLEQTARQLAKAHGLSAQYDPQAEMLRPRLLLRAGRLREARQLLEERLWSEQSCTRATGHREPLLLLALINAMLGAGPQALAFAHRMLIEAQQSGNLVTEALAELRLGHAYQLIARGDDQAALQHYSRGLRLLQQVTVPRTRAEGYLGLTLLHGHAGDLARAEADAREGLLLAASAGDEWVAALMLLALGSVTLVADDPRGYEWLDQAEQRFQAGRDTFGLFLVHLWRALAALRVGRTTAVDPLVDQVMHEAVEYGYEHVLIGPSLFGPRDIAALVPLLLRARTMPAHRDTAIRLLRQGFPSIATDDTVDDYHPGFTLRVQLLGAFRVWRGNQEIQAREWQREKARQLFQLLLTMRGNWVQREQICAWLWPDADLEAAERQFKVTLNTLNAALEPHRPPRVPPFFIRRQGLAYSFAPSFGVWIDVDEFELRASSALTATDPDFARRSAQAALQLYRGDYLAESLYDPWTTEERERLLARYLATAVAYAERLSAEGKHNEAIQIAEQVLRRDRCYEEAYQLLMRAHARAGSRSQAMRAYTRCVQALREELGIEPLAETEALYLRIRLNEPI
ncbi:MAG: transcriptional activator [Chloroflexus sp.]|uniref:BTAD domain-containing putative transcriptional regulator n=1 Tax=Chloroflexus sp. TaxID=1904827 RepID=UPI0021DCFA83|nr:BTAD domain-containing putative transcriptional regulator [Chloroflexus sp.]GIV91209.1 MAG: transcriptional activator [Chloroflexus sp.]